MSIVTDSKAAVRKLRRQYETSVVNLESARRIYERIRCELAEAEYQLALIEEDRAVHKSKG